MKLKLTIEINEITLKSMKAYEVITCSADEGEKTNFSRTFADARRFVDRQIQRAARRATQQKEKNVTS